MTRDELERWLRTNPAEADAEADGPHVDDERLAVLAESGHRPESDALHHLARCEACREVYVDLASTRRPIAAPRWRPPVLWSALAGTVGAAAAAILLLLPSAQKPTLTVDVLHDSARTRGSASVGDTLRVQSSFPHGEHGELRIYLEEVGPVLRCPGAAPCRAEGDALGADLVLERRGRYRVLLLTSPRPIERPFTTFADDYESLPEDVHAHELRVEVF